MVDLPSLTPRQVIKILEKHGFFLKRQKGSHRLYVKGNHFVTIPYHNKDFKRSTLKSIIKQSGLTEEEFRKKI